MVDDTGVELEGVQIRASLADAKQPPWVVQSDEQGRFAIDTLPNANVEIAFEVTGHARTSHMIERDRTFAQDWKVVLEKVASISGRVYGPNGEAVAQAHITLAGSGVWPALNTQTNAQGRFVWNDVPPGNLRTESAPTNADPRSDYGLGAQPRRATGTVFYALA